MARYTGNGPDGIDEVGFAREMARLPRRTRPAPPVVEMVDPATGLVEWTGSAAHLIGANRDRLNPGGVDELLDAIAQLRGGATEAHAGMFVLRLAVSHG